MPKWEHNSKICCLKAGLCKRNRQNWQKPPSIAAIKLQQEGVSRRKSFTPVIMDRLIVPVRVRIASMVGYARKHDSTVIVPVRARIASGLSLLVIMELPVTVPVRVRIASSYDDIQTEPEPGYSPREDANCIWEEMLASIHQAKVTVPVRVRIASAKGYNSCNKNQIILYNSQIHYTDKSFAFQ